MEQLKRMKNSIKERALWSWQWLQSEKGQGLVEYALILVLIAVVVIAILTGLGQKVSNVFSNINNQMPPP